MSTERVLPDWPAPATLVAGTTTIHADLNRLPVAPVYLNQVHGAAVVSAESLRRTTRPVDADAVVATAAGEICAVRTADCLPLLLCAADGTDIAAVHGGWRGVAAGVIENAVAAMNADPRTLLAWFGPAISQANFEVGEEVRQVFIEHDADAVSCFERNDRGRWQADLYGLARQRLNAVGVSRIYGGDRCTYGEPALFHSYRRNPDCGRMVSFVYRRE